MAYFESSCSDTARSSFVIYRLRNTAIDFCGDEGGIQLYCQVSVTYTCHAKAHLIQLGHGHTLLEAVSKYGHVWLPEESAKLIGQHFTV